MIKSLFRSLLPGSKPAIQAETGPGTEISGNIVKMQAGGKIRLGSDCLLEGTLCTYLDASSIHIGDNVFIGNNSLIAAAESISIQDDVLVSFDCLIADNDSHHLNYEIRKNDNRRWKNGRQKDWTGVAMKAIVIEKGAWIGAKSIILKGVHIGEGAVVGAGSVVTRDVEAFTLVAGNPARFIRKIS